MTEIDFCRYCRDYVPFDWTDSSGKVVYCYCCKHTEEYFHDNLW